jgi:hypothetical protein
VNIDIEQASAMPLCRKRNRQIHGNRAFADTTFARHYDNGMLD